MEFRSSNSKFTHHQGDFVSNVDDGSSHGVHLTGGSTGGIVQPAGDEDNIALNVRAKGTGPVRVGNSSQTVVLSGPLSVTGAVTSTGAVAFTSTHVNINSTRVGIGGSTTTFTGIRRVRIDFTVPALSSHTAVTSSLTVAGLTTNSAFILQPRGALNSTIAGVSVTGLCSTAGSLNLTFRNISETTLSGSTQSAYLIEFGMPAAVP